MNASAERVWSILADDFENVAHWASTIPASGPNPLAVTVPEGAASAMPGFVTGAQNAWAVSELGAGRTQVSSTASARVTGLLGALAAPMLRIRFGRTVRPALDDLRLYAETGQVSARKARRTSTASRRAV